MIKIIFFFIAFCFKVSGQSIKDNIEKSIYNCFGKEVNIVLDKIKLDKKLKQEIESKAEQSFFSDQIYFYKIFRDEHTIGYAILDNVFGKSMPMTFIVMFDKIGKILCSEIIKYREQYGGAVKNKDWLMQFNGKNADSEIKIGNDINTISGSTISVYSVTKGIKKLSFLIKELIQQ